MSRTHVILLLICASISKCSIHIFDDHLACPSEWISFGASCYHFVRAPVLRWLEAQFFCTERHASLLVSDSREEHEFITWHLRDTDPTYTTWYTGGFDPLSTGEWTWLASDLPNQRISNDDPNWILQNLPQEEVQTYVQAAFPNGSEPIGRALAYNFSSTTKQWGWLPVSPDRSRPFICELPRSKTFDVPAIERTIDFGTYEPDANKILHAPVIYEELKDAVFDTTAKAYQNWITLTCCATGYPEPEFTWYRVNFENGHEVHYLVDPLSDGNVTQMDGSLTIYNPTPQRSRGEYFCMASNRLGTARSRKAAIRFGYVGDFALRREPTQLVLYNGGAVPCDPPTHYPAVTYSWSRDVFPNFVEENRRVFVSQDGNLYFSHVESSDEGTYQCVVKSTVAEIGKTGPFFQVMVKRQHSVGQLKIWSSFPKVFPSAPVAGDNVSIECLASGYPTPRYDWRRVDAESLPLGFYTKKFNRVLHLPNVRASDSGKYECTASSSQGTVSAIFHLEINVKPTFLVPLKPQLLDAGSEATLTCAAFGKPAVSHRWYKDGQLIRPDHTGKFVIEGDRLIMRDVQDSQDTGVIQCEARNILGSAFSTGELRVVSAAPSFRKRPIPFQMEVVAGGNITIPCQPEAAPRPVTRWLLNTFPLPTSNRHRVLGNGNLHIFDAVPTDQGLYTCHASNALGTDSSTGFLRVIPPPRVVEAPSSLVVPVNGSAVFRCHAEAEAQMDLAYDWKLNDMPLDKESNGKRFIGWKDRRGYLFITRVTYDDVGDYTCVVRTPVSTVSYTARLEVAGSPGPPFGLQALPLGNSPNSVLLRWTDGYRNGPAYSFYRLEAWSNHTKIWMVLIPDLVASRAIMPNRKEFDLISRLQPWNSYRFRISASNQFGWSNPSQPSATFDVPPAAPVRPPLFVGGGGGRPGHLTVTWEKIPGHEQNAPGIGYRILFRKFRTDEDFEEVIVNGDIGRAKLKIGEDEIYQPYEVQVRPFNIMCDGPISRPYVVYSAEKPPTVAPVNLIATPFNATAIDIKWAYPSTTKPTDFGGRLTGHRVKYWKRGWNEEEALTSSVGHTDEFARIKGLEPFTEYHVVVMAVNSAGFGPQSEIAHGRTYKSEPSQFPMGVRVRIVRWDTVMVDWRGLMTTPQEEPILGYKIRYWRKGEHVKQAKDLTLTLEELNGRFEVLLSGLIPEESYNLRVLAYSHGGDGRMSSPVWQFRMAMPNGGHVSVQQPPLLAIFIVIACETVLRNHN